MCSRKWLHILLITALGVWGIAILPHIIKSDDMCVRFEEKSA